MTRSSACVTLSLLNDKKRPVACRSLFTYHCSLLIHTYMEQNSTTEDMKTLSECFNKLVQTGYEEDFNVNEKGLFSPTSGKTYSPEKVTVINFFRFEGASDPDENSILYAIETSDGIKGTLTDAYGTYADPKVGKFMQQVDSISKKTTKTEGAPAS